MQQHIDFPMEISVIKFQTWQFDEKLAFQNCFCYYCLQMYCYYNCSVTLPHGAVGWSVVCDCGNPDLTHLLFFLNDQTHF